MAKEKRERKVEARIKMERRRKPAPAAAKRSRRFEHMRAMDHVENNHFDAVVAEDDALLLEIDVAHRRVVEFLDNGARLGEVTKPAACVFSQTVYE